MAATVSVATAAAMAAATEEAMEEAVEAGLAQATTTWLRCQRRAALPL